ncbi:hypothetical protein BH11PSE8_BH11PSE8_17850 [soil metagenome]
MGIDLHNLHFMAHAQDLGVSFERSLGVGRQAVFIEDRSLQKYAQARGLSPLREPPRAPGAPQYFEALMQQWLGAKVVDSVDASPYENARLIHDMNAPWPVHGPLAEERARYDAVLDFGCLEHVFDFPTAWRNCIDLCMVGGHVLHALPANNLCGHGFYQFSPELFFNLYRPQRGFELKALFFAQKADPSTWWRVANPMDVKRRVNLCNSHEVYMLVLARKLREVGPLPPPQQSDYAQDEWITGPSAAAAHAVAPDWRRTMAQGLQGVGLIDAARSWRHRLRVLRSSGFELPAPDYQRVAVDALIRRSGSPQA